MLGVEAQDACVMVIGPNDGVREAHESDPPNYGKLGIGQDNVSIL
jgi:hypothetical protein